VIERLLRAVLAGLSGLAMLVFAALAILRIPHPLELDAIEGVMMDHITRLAHGQPIYVEPSLEFIPLASMPGFAALASLLARAFGPHFWEPRLLSLLGILATAGVVAKVVRVETESRLLALVAAGVLLGGFGITGNPHDVGRPDSIMLFFAFSGLALLRFTNGFWGALGASLLLALAFFTRHHAAWFVVAALVHLAVNERGRLVPFVLGIALFCGGGYALLAQYLGPWFVFFTWDVPTHWWQLSRERVLQYVSGGLIGKLGPLTLSSLLALALPVRLWRGRGAIWLFAALGGMAAGLMATLDPVAYGHTMVPALVGFCIAGPIALLRVVNHLAAWPDSERAGRSWVMYAVLLLQFVPLAYGVRSQMPHPRARQAHAELMSWLRSYPGPVLMFYHGHYTWQAGKGTTFQQSALDDIIRARGNRLLASDPKYFDRMFQALREGPDRPMIVTDVELEKTGLESRTLWQSVASHYRLEGELGWISEPMKPINAAHRTPRLIYVPIEAEVAEAAPPAGKPVAAAAAAATRASRVPSSRTQ
jgi:hypothetical protein